MKSNRRILIVDDNEDISFLIEHILHSNGYETLIANDGEQAIQIVSSQNIDLVLLDLSLPGISGLEVLTQLKASAGEEISKIPVVIITAHSSEADYTDAIEIGASAYILKPFTPQALTEAVDNILG